MRASLENKLKLMNFERKKRENSVRKKNPWKTRKEPPRKKKETSGVLQEKILEKMNLTKGRRNLKKKKRKLRKPIERENNSTEKGEKVENP